MSSTALPHDVEDYIRANLGEDTFRVAAELSRLGSATDTVLAEILDTRTSYIRKALYALYEARVAEYQERRDKENGWLTFVWSMDAGTAKAAIEETKEAMADDLRTRMQRLEAEPHYRCAQCEADPEVDSTWVPMQQAVSSQFQCRACGCVLEEADVPGRIRELSKTLATLRT